MMWTRLSVLALSLAAGFASANRGVINSENGEIPLNSDIGRAVMEQARSLQNNNNNYNYNNNNNNNNNNNGNNGQNAYFLQNYALKFQGCHHVQQWNPNADDEEDVRIMTKRLVRFRLCPSNDCNADTTGCTSHYGDYVVDMNTFVDAYLTVAANNGAQNMCNQYINTCKGTCGNNGDCIQQCLQSYGAENCYNNNNRELANNFDIMDYVDCAQFDMRRRELANNNNNNNNANANYYQDTNYYIGPYCADQGGEIHLGVFTDDTCTSFASGGESRFYSTMGFKLPYSDTSMVSQVCMSCAYGDLCSTVYPLSGKCETRMSIDYPNESSCSYIEGIKIIREDGVIRTSATKKSKAAAVCIGLFLTIAVLLAGYVYYLRTSKYYRLLNCTFCFENCFLNNVSPTFSPEISQNWDAQRSTFPLLPRLWPKSL